MLKNVLYGNQNFTTNFCNSLGLSEEEYVFFTEEDTFVTYVGSNDVGVVLIECAFIFLKDLVNKIQDGRSNLLPIVWISQPGEHDDKLGFEVGCVNVIDPNTGKDTFMPLLTFTKPFTW